MSILKILRNLFHATLLIAASALSLQSCHVMKSAGLQLLLYVGLVYSEVFGSIKENHVDEMGAWKSRTFKGVQARRFCETSMSWKIESILPSSKFKTLHYHDNLLIHMGL